MAKFSHTTNFDQMENCMAWYQACRHLLDFSNNLDIEYGTYVQTDCIKWISRFGSDFRPLGPGELPKPTFKCITVLDTVEDKIKEIVSVESTQKDQEVVEEVKEEVKIKSFKPPVSRRKVKTPNQVE